MSVHVGKLIKEVKEKSRITVDELLAHLPYKTHKAVHRHWASADLNTDVIRHYVRAYRVLGITVDLFELLAQRERGEEEPINIHPAPKNTNGPSLAHEPVADYDVVGDEPDEDVSTLLRRAADLLDKKKKP